MIIETFLQHIKRISVHYATKLNTKVDNKSLIIDAVFAYIKLVMLAAVNDRFNVKEKKSAKHTHQTKQ